MAISGIAKPQMFKKMLLDNKFDLKKHFVFKDHYNFSILDVQNIIAEAHASGVKTLVTTEKDLVRLTNFVPLILASQIRLFAVSMEVRPKSDIKGLYEQVISILR